MCIVVRIFSIILFSEINFIVNGFKSQYLDYKENLELINYWMNCKHITQDI